MNFDNEKFDRNNTDILIILKEDKPVSYEKAFQDLQMEYELSEWDFNKQEWIRNKEKAVLEISPWVYDNFVYNGEEFIQTTNIRDRLIYALSCLHNDDAVEQLMKEKISEIEGISITNMRGTTKPYLQHWMEKYNFTLEDFLFNDKYIVISDNMFHHKVYQMYDLGLLNLDGIEHLSCEEELEEEE